MKKSIWIFLFAVLLPGFVLGWLALRSAEEQQIIFERRTAELYQKETESLAASAREAVESERRAFGDTVHRLLARSDAAALAKDFTNSLMDAWPRKAVGFVLGPGGEMLSPTTTMAAKDAELRDFLWNNGSFLCSTQPAVVYPVAIESPGKALAYNQALRSRSNATPDAKPALTVQSAPAATVLAQKGGAAVQQQAGETRFIKAPVRGAEPRAKEKTEDVAVAPAEHSAEPSAAGAAAPAAPVQPPAMAGQARKQETTTTGAPQAQAPGTKGDSQPAARPAVAFQGTGSSGAVRSTREAKELAKAAPPPAPSASANPMPPPAPDARPAPRPSSAVARDPAAEALARRRGVAGDSQSTRAAEALQAAAPESPAVPLPRPTDPEDPTAAEMAQANVSSIPALEPTPALRKQIAGGAIEAKRLAERQAVTRGREGSPATAEEQRAGESGAALDRSQGRQETAALTDLASQQSLYSANSASAQSANIYNRLAQDALNRMVEPQQQTKSAVSNWSAILPATADFRALTEGYDEGMLARFVQDKLDLIFWIRPPEAPEMVFGCLIEAGDLEELWKELFASRVAEFPEERPPFVLALLNDKARPVATFPAAITGRDWKRPFVANEVGEVLPHWEAALYLATPTAMADTARGLRRTLSFTIAGAIALIAIGGWLVVHDARRQLALAQQKTDFVSNVSHELKTPLTSIRMFAELMHDRPPAMEKQGQYLRIIRVEAERLTRLINNVLDFAKLERRQRRFDKKPLDLCNVITRVWEGQEMHLRDAGFATRWQAAPGPYPVLGDEDALAQILVNLLSNAEKYSQEQKDIELVTWVEGGWINASVLDRGIGVPAGEERKIFEAFYRAHDSLSSGIQGSGLGLTLAQRVAREHGGEILFERRQDGGSRFTLRLPLVPNHAGEPSRAGAEPPGAPA